ncbi:MAG: (cytosine-5-)-methyltransferase [Caulobacter sp.]|nr:(cytosine-5-)-methyltransferase [Caulobacter sp.]
MAKILGPTIVDLFSGCGGFGLGAELAGFQTVAAVDIDPDLQSAYKLNLPHANAFTGDVGLLDKDAWAEKLGSIHVDGVIGGPPCQGFSRIGKRDADDPRNSLIGHFFRQVELLCPKFFLMENVEGLLDQSNRARLDAALSAIPKNFVVHPPKTIEAADFGAATSRKRVILFGYDPDKMPPVAPSDLVQSNRLTRPTVRQAIGDLPSPLPQILKGSDWGWAGYPQQNSKSLVISNYARALRSAAPKGLGWAEASGRLRGGEVSGLFETNHTPEVVERFAATAAGKTEAISRYPRLDWDGLCPTLRAGTGRDRGSFQAMRPIHPSEARVITVREAARLQGFPDWYVFHKTKWHSFRMIGNSVPPPVAKALLSNIRMNLGEPVGARRQAFQA